MDITEHEDIEERLRHIGIAIDMGCVANVRWMLHHWGAKLEIAQDPSHRVRYASILDKAAAMLEIEKEHGSGSLLKFEHPIVASLLRRPSPCFLPSEIEAARRYQASRATGDD